MGQALVFDEISSVASFRLSLPVPGRLMIVIKYCQPPRSGIL